MDSLRNITVPPRFAVGSEDSKDSCILVTHSNLIKVTHGSCDREYQQVVSWEVATGCSSTCQHFHRFPAPDLVGFPTEDHHFPLDMAI